MSEKGKTIKVIVQLPYHENSKLEQNNGSKLSSAKITGIVRVR